MRKIMCEDPNNNNMYVHSPISNAVQWTLLKILATHVQKRLAQTNSTNTTRISFILEDRNIHMICHCVEDRDKESHDIATEPSDLRRPERTLGPYQLLSR